MRKLLIVFLLVSLKANSQQVSISLGACVSLLDIRTDYDNSIFFEAPIVLPSASIAYETKIWHRFSLAANASFFVVGGRSRQLYPSYPLYFANYSIGIIPNFYLVNRQSKFYIGIGPRIDDMVWFSGENNSLLKSYYFKFGLTGSIGYNYHFDHFFVGVKANYYHKFGIINYRSYYELGFQPGTIIYRDRTIRGGRTFDLQFVVGYRFGKKQK